MMKKWLHILILVPLLLAAGCQGDPSFERAVTGMLLTVRCEDPDLVKSETADGETLFNENLIKSVDFFFYPGDNPSETVNAVYHHRIDLEEDPVSHTGGRWEATFNLVLPRVTAEEIFTTAGGMSATVYAVINYDGDFTPGGSLNGTSLSDLASTVVITNFATTEVSYIQNSFLMDGKTVVTYDDSAVISASGTINAKRFAAKMTTAISVANVVTLKHSGEEPDEVWTPVLHTMRIYLVDGAYNVTLGTESGSDNTNPQFFSYSAETCRRPFVMDNGTTYLSSTSVDTGSGVKTYYNTYPMYSYPIQWSTGQPDYSQPLPKQPYLKLEIDWRRTEDHGYSYDRRKYYYKVILPVNSLERNNWYHLNIDVAILGSETDEGKAVIEPTCYILDWQNKSVPIDKYAVISKARYLSVDARSRTLNNLTTLSIPFLSSHDVKIVEGSVTATRPYYGVITDESTQVDVYNTTYHAWVRKNTDGSYFLEYNGQDLSSDGNPAYEPSNWLYNTSTSIEFNHTLQNDYTRDDFDYSPYTIEFDIVHDDLTPGIYPYNEYLKHITVIQYPGIYIESCMNSDSEIRATSDNNGTPFYPIASEKPWLDKPWGYVYIDNGRFIRTGNDSTEPYKKLTTENNKREYQWRTVWYTGGGRDIFKINVTVLPQNSGFIIGDPRIDGYDTTVPVLGYSFVNDGTAAGDAVLGNHTGESSNFTPAPVVDGDVNTPMALTGDTRPLKFYRPTEATDRTKNMIAPAYRISTKLGGTEFGKITENQAKWRCAGYQEDGFPAGRWRIPTMSEIKFIAQLSAKGVFESMFSGEYWSANSVVKVNRENGTVTILENDHMAYLRCVYDSWYWGDEQWNPRTQFVWGDRQP